MRDNRIIHPLAAPNQKAGMIRFNGIDGKEHTFHTCVNRLTGDRMSGFDNDAPNVNEPLTSIRAVFGDIRATTTVLETIGDF